MENIKAAEGYPTDIIEYSTHKGKTNGPLTRYKERTERPLMGKTEKNGLQETFRKTDR